MQVKVIMLIGFLLVAMGALAADHPWQITSAEGDATVVLGFLAQPQLEFVRTSTGTGDMQNIYLRRFRLIASGNFTSKISFFIDTDSPNLGRATAAKIADSIYLQDAIITYKIRPEIQIDGGLLLVAYSHNSGQSAATLLPIDYGPYTFLPSDSTVSRVGRDYGIQARGYLLKNHLEYRAGLFQGSRTQSGTSTGTTSDFRYAGRVTWYPFEAETGFFYTGTTLGKKKILSLGTGFDHQMNYNTISADIFYDQPIWHGDGLTMQLDYMHIDGGSTFPQLAREHVWLGEVGYYYKTAKIGPFVQLSNRLFTNPSTPDLKKYLGGIAYWGSGHRLNVKLGIGRSFGSPSMTSWQVALQAQTFVY